MEKLKINHTNPDWIYYGLWFNEKGEIRKAKAIKIERYFKVEEFESHLFIFHQPLRSKKILITESKSGGTVKSSTSLDDLEKQFNEWKSNKKRFELIVASIKCRDRAKKIISKYK